MEYIELIFRNIGQPVLFIGGIVVVLYLITLIKPKGKK